MSVGLALTDDERERERLAAAMAPPPGGIVKIEEPFVIDSAPPPAPYRSAGAPNEPRFGIDPTEPSPMALLGSTNATVKGSPLPGGGLAAEQLAAAATTPAAPADAVDRVLAANPVPPPLPPPAGPLNVRAEAEKTIRGQDDLAAQAEAAVRKEAEVRKAQAVVAQTEADEKARVVREETERQQQALDAANARTQTWLDKAEAEADKHAKMEYKDFWADKSTGSKVLAGLSMLFGAVGRAGSDNPGMRIINNAIERDFRLQQARIEKQGTIARDAREGHRSALTQMHELRADLALKKAAALEAVAAQGESLKRKSGVSMEEAKTDANIVALRQEAGKERMGGLNTLHKWNVDDEQLKIAHERNAAIAARAKKAKGGGGGGGQPGAMEQLSRYAIDHPGDQPGLYRLAGELKIPKPDKAVASVINQTKSTESQTKDAKQGAIGLRAVDAIEQSGYTPTKAEIQKWLNNQKQVAQAAKAGEGGGIGGFIGGSVAGFAQGKGLVAQSETDGLSEPAKDYFANVRRFMETIGRAQSGAAISNAEWTNFLNQYGPNSKGGLGAARLYLQDQFKVSGVAGKQLESGVPAPAAKQPSTKLSNKDLAIKVQAQKVVKDPNADAQTKRDAQAFLDRVGD